MSLIPQNLLAGHGRSLASVGLDSPTPALQRTADGAIDYNYYLKRSSALRAASYAAAFRGLAKLVRGAVSKLAAAYHNWQAHRRAVAELNELDDRTLRDLGVNRAGLDYIVDHGREDVPAPANANTRKAA
jgi:uncharacterized protein YjiS (DUF1127 family)